MDAVVGVDAGLLQAARSPSSAQAQSALMLANLLGIAGVDVVVLERNEGLVGLPRAIAYDIETLRLFAQIGLFAMAKSASARPRPPNSYRRNLTLAFLTKGGANV
jgi:2-polyprenyl-6-methoxyphenol hydroxylase-like FAD-dependent oxidoreductase